MIREGLSASCGDDNYANPAPVVSGIAISDLAGNSHPRRWQGIVDTGADRTVIPLGVCEDLSLSPRDWRRPRSFDREAAARQVPLYYVRMDLTEIGDITLLAYAVRRTNILLGRDFLSALVLLIDGPGSGWQLGRHSWCSRLVTRLLRLG